MSVDNAVITAHTVSHEKLANHVANFLGVGYNLPRSAPGFFYLKSTEGYFHTSLEPDLLGELSQESDWLTVVTSQLGLPPKSIILIAI